MKLSKIFLVLGAFAGFASQGQANQGINSIVSIQQAKIQNLEARTKLLSQKGELVFNSVANENGVTSGDQNTLAFWRIPFKDRLVTKGTPSLSTNYYNPAAYLKPGAAIYLDEVEDIEGNVGTVLVASASGFDPATMKFYEPVRIAGRDNVFLQNFASGWSSYDHDGDEWNQNCAAVYGEVSQHYGKCWTYSLGADADADRADQNWGPHGHTPSFKAMGFAVESTGSYTRLQRVTRYRLKF